VLVHEDQLIVDLVIDGESLTTTPEHPFYTLAGWEVAGELEVGDHIWSISGEWGRVEAVSVSHDPQLMYNLTVDDAHTFFVGEQAWLVHNPCLPAIPRDLSESKITVIGRMEDLRRFHDNDLYDTWWKSGRIPERDGGRPVVGWPENRQWLDERINANDIFYIATDPETLSSDWIEGVPNGNFTWRELDYLKNKGIEVLYRPDP
jgi:hypothetical protein